jgi:type I restriction enzyme S subunit
MKYWDIIPFPNFPPDKQTEIARLYHNADAAITVDRLTVENFIVTDNVFNETAGIVELDKTAKKIKTRINEVIDLIVRDEPVKTAFDFLLPASHPQSPPADTVQ